MRIESERNLLPEIRGQEAVSGDIAAAFGLAFAQAMTSTAVSAVGSDAKSAEGHTPADSAETAVDAVGDAASLATNDDAENTVPLQERTTAPNPAQGPTPTAATNTETRVAPPLAGLPGIAPSGEPGTFTETTALRDALSIPAIAEGDASTIAATPTPKPEVRPVALIPHSDAATGAVAAIGATAPSQSLVAAPIEGDAETTHTDDFIDTITTVPTSQHHRAPSREVHALGATSSTPMMSESMPTPAPTAPANATPVAPTSPPAAPPAMPSPAHQLVAIVAPLRVRADGTTRLTLGLRPEHLGAVDVEVRIENGVVHLHVRAEQPATVELLRDSIDDLRGQLSQRGVAAGDVSVGGRSSQGNRNTTPHAHHNASSLEIDQTGPVVAPATNPDALVDVRM